MSRATKISEKLGEWGECLQIFKIRGIYYYVKSATSIWKNYGEFWKKYVQIFKGIIELLNSHIK